MINIMLTMGYCVDFTAHMTRTYVSSKGKSRYEKTRESVGEFGFAILQSSVAAIMAVLSLGSSYAYILRCGFRFFFVGICLSVYHTLVVFPVLLMYLGPQPLKQHRKDLNEKSRRRHRRKRIEDDAEEIERAARKFRQTLLVEGKDGFPSEDKVISISDAGPATKMYISKVEKLPELDNTLNGNRNSSLTSTLSDSNHSK